MSKDSDYLHWCEKQEEFISHLDSWLNKWEGCTICACDHGCNQWILDNAVKMLAITKAINIRSEQLEKMVFQQPEEFVNQLHQQMWDRKKK